MGIDKRDRRYGGSERTLKMIHWSVEQLKAGEKLPSVEELAKKFHVCTRTVRNHLGEIAEKADVTRESLLTNPIPQRGTIVQKRKPLTEVLDLEKFHEHYLSVVDDIHGMENSMVREIKRQENFITEYEGGTR